MRDITYNQLRKFIAEYAEKLMGPELNLTHTEPGSKPQVTGAAINFAVAVLDFARNNGETK